MEAVGERADAIRGALVSSDLGVEVSVHGDAESALGEIAAAGSKFDVALSSNKLPDATGLEVYSRLHRERASIPLVLLFEEGEENDASAALLAGVDDVLLRDNAGGYLRLIPGVVTKSLRVSDMTTVAPERLAVIIQSDPASTEYMDAASTLRGSEPFWRALVENPFEYVLLVDKSATIQYLNRTAPGIDFMEVIGKATLYDFIAPEMHDTVRAELHVVFDEGKAAHFESYATAIGRWFTNTAGPLYKDGEIIGASVFSRDITEQKTIENELKKSEQRFRQFAEAVKEVFYILDLAERRAIYVSPAYEAVFGQSMSLIYANAMSWMDVVHPADRDSVMDNFQGMMASGGEGYQSRAYRVIKPDGEVRWLRHRSYVIQNDFGEAKQIAGVASDITAEKEAEQKLRESEEKYRTLVDLASDGILLTDQEGRHLDANKAACELLGYSREEFLKLSYRDTIPEEDLVDAPPRFDELKEGRHLVSERRLRRKDGSIVHVEGSYTVQPSGKIQVILRNITERKRAEEKLRKTHGDLERRVEERTRELKQTIEAAHEINNPIGSILMAADTALYSIREDDSGEAEEALKSIKNDAKRAGDIVRTVLQLSRHEESQKWSHDLGDLARKARDITRRKATAGKVTVQLEIEDDLPQATVNPTEIEQVFVNIASNAIEASQPGQTVTVRLARDGDRLRALFEDQGRGMKQDESSRVFDPFYTTRQSEGGTGLGLSLTHSILHGHGGAIDIDTQPGEGTRVTVTIPINRESGEKPKRQPDEG
jgi:PAS domain S-box-containing protein